MCGDVLHNAIAEASLTKQLGRFEYSDGMNTSTFLHVSTIAPKN
jgi:hypothetical protein